MSATSSSSSQNTNSNNNPGNVLSSSSSAASNIVILENQVLDSNDVVAAAGLQQLSNAGTLKLTRDCAVQYSNLMNSYTASSNSNTSGNSSGTTIVGNSSTQMNTVNIIPGDANQASSRVQVLSNVQLVSKGGSQPSTFSYVDASGKNFNVLTTTGKIGSNKLISVPITKVKTLNHIGGQQQQQQAQIVSSSVQQQKVTVPRSIQLVTRIPNSTISVSNGRVSQIASAISSPPQPTNQQQFTIQQYPDSGASFPTSTIITTCANTVSKTVPAKCKSAAASLRMMPNATVNQLTSKPPSVGKGMSVSLKNVRTNSKAAAVSSVNSPQYFVKSSTNGAVQQLGGTTSIYTTSPAQAVYHNPTPHPISQPVSNPFVTAYSNTGKGRNVYKTSKNQLITLQQQQQQQQHQQQQPLQSSPQRSVTPSPSSGSISTIPQNSGYGGSAASTLVQGVHSSSTGAYDSTIGASSSAVDHHGPVVPSMTVTGYSSSTGKGKKYTTIVNNDVSASPVKARGVGRGRNNSLSSYQQQPSEPGSYQRYSASPSRPTQQQFHPPPLTSNAVTTLAGGTRDDQIFINGQQMTDEASARILQSLANKTPDSGGKYSCKQQQTFNFYGSESFPQSASNRTGGVMVNLSNPTPPGVVYDPSDSRFYEEKSEGRRSSTSEIITYADNIPLREGFPASYTYNHRDDDDQIGEEVRPAPVDTSHGLRYHILQAVLQDHTYVAVGPELKLPEPPPAVMSSVPLASATTQSMQNQSSQMLARLPTQTTSKLQSSLCSSSAGSVPYPSVMLSQSPSSHPTTAVSVSAGTTAIPSASVPAPLTQMSLSTLAAITASQPGSCGISSSSVPCGGSTLDLYQRSSATADVPTMDAQDDDANSVISTGSRNLNSTENDLGEETETAPEGEGEDDSVTRCICDLTHDDGYMICCDKCSAWQHVDCMGIDRMNIPDEYNCEMCQPRPVDKARARLLQLEKRKEQSLFLANNNLQLPVADSAVSSSNIINSQSGTGTTASSGSGKGANQYTTGKAVAGSKKNKSAGGSGKKKANDGSPAASKKNSKKSSDSSSLNRVNGKRKELKKPSKKKVKSNEPNAEKMSNMIRNWIDNYERAITNHYSPELRARLQAFGKMQSQNPLLNSDRLIPAMEVMNLQQKCTTVPHAGGKILISTGDIEPRAPIIEIRGKYMLSSQHKPLQSLFNMAANGKLANNKNAGPFLFLYQLTQGGMELCVDTRTYGNDARFIRRSCRPNAEILHNIEKGVVHLYIVSTANIKANTEITIKHDEQLIQRVGGVVILTHTTVTNLCACGLIKECQYSAQLSDGLFPTQAAPPSSLGGVPTGGSTVGGLPPTTIGQVMPFTSSGTGKPSKSKKNNGALVGDNEKKPAKKRNSRSTSSSAEARLRSISSSGESVNEMMLYAQQQQQLHLQQQQASLQQQPSLSPVPQQSQFQQISSQHLISQQLPQTALHYIHHQHQQQQQQHQPTISNHPVYMYSPSPTHQPTMTLAPPAHHPVHPQTPPPSSPVMGMTNRPGFYTEIKSPLNSPPLNLSGPPPLVIPAMASPVKSMLQLQMSPVPNQSSAPVPLTSQQHDHHQILPAIVNAPTQQTQQPLEQIPLESITHQQHYQQQQQIMEDILRIKIKSPIASPIKQEVAPPKSPVQASMLSPPPPPPIPIAQRILSAETLKSELFHSHQQPQAQVQQRQPVVHVPPLANLRPQSPVKTEFPKIEVKQEHSLLLSPPRSVISSANPSRSPVDVKIEQQEIKKEPDLQTAKIEDPQPSAVPKVEPSEQPCCLSPKREPSPTPVLDDSKEDIVPMAATASDTTPCDSAPNTPVKSQPPSAVTTPVASGCPTGDSNRGSNNNSTNSSPHSTSQHHTGSSSKKKASKDSTKEHTADPVKEEKKPSRKLTREERKMEAIVKAFEKMEQSQQRKQELKEQRKEGKRRSVSSSTPDESGAPGSAVSGPASAKKKSLSSQQKRKKKKSKSLSQHFGSPNQSRKKKVSKSSKTPSSSKKRSSSSAQQNTRPQESRAAELLLTLSQTNEQERKTEQQSLSQSYFGDDVQPVATDDAAESSTINLTNTTSKQNSENETQSPSETSIPSLPLLSSACMLIEAAVGPLEQASSTTPTEQDFKFPQKAKTKKSMSREWLSGQATGGESPATLSYRRTTPDQDSGYMSEEKTLDFRRGILADDSISTPLGVDVGEPNICIMAKKVEEFIAQNSPQSDEVSGHKWDDKVSSAGSLTCLTAAGSQEQHQTPTSGGNVSESASVKKRWLRQAISEETDELMHASNSPPPPNGFTTPLKKRRVIRQSEDAQQTQNQTFMAAQKIDFAGTIQQQTISQPITSSPQHNYHEPSLYWSNTGPPPLTYSARSHSMLDEKQAMDLSRTAPIRIAQQHIVPRIQPYKIVPIAQALTPLHFTDPDPLPVPPVTVQSHLHHHQLLSREPQELQRLETTPVERTYEPLPPPSAMAAMVPASLIPPELQPINVVTPVSSEAMQQPQQQARIDMSYSALPVYHQQVNPSSVVTSAPIPPVRNITRSKGSKKYIASPAKFQQPPSPADSQSSCSVTETPEKNSNLSSSTENSAVNSDIDEEQQSVIRATISDQQVPMGQSIAIGEEAVILQQTEAEEPIGTAPDDGTKEYDPVVEDVVMEKEETFMQEEQVVSMGEVFVEQEVVPMDTSGETVTNDDSDLLESQEGESFEQQQKRPLTPVNVSVVAPLTTTIVENIKALNGRDKPTLLAGDRDENELEDLQKVIASFHSENIMNLISRNKKTKKSTSREGSGEDRPRTKRLPRNRQHAISVAVSPPPKAAIPAVPQVGMMGEMEAVEEIKTSVEGVEISTTIAEASVALSQPVVQQPTFESAVSAIPVLTRTYSQPSWLSATTETFREVGSEVRSLSSLRPDIPPISYNSPSTYQSTAARNLLSSLSVGSEPLSTLGSYRTGTSSFLDYPKPSINSIPAVVGATTSIYQYRPSTEISTLLEKGFSSSRPSSFSTLSSSSTIIGTERTGTAVISSNTSIGTSSSTILSSSTLGVSPKITENLSTLGGSNNATSYPKIFTKTASSDPRLNPALTVPEPVTPITPKRKLSINEYRQRKMQSCPATSTSSVASSSMEGMIAAASSSTAPSSASSSNSNSRDGSNLISSSLESNDVSSSISKELNLELELELSRSEDEESDAAASKGVMIELEEHVSATEVPIVTDMEETTVVIAAASEPTSSKDDAVQSERN
ncbi:mucin-17 isoform X2 [Wyeomyia smithii]|uniref:mucin-17 isoform X2 n=1 Tax=Wyeomyia smithii TaxID=174621 RepID=UPI0024681A4E|nr:mucin-17 isoform X2 [Wyeomyia smithii]